MRKFDWKYGIYGCIIGLMFSKIWARAHERSPINLRPVFQPDSSGRTKARNCKNDPPLYPKKGSVARLIPIDKPVGLAKALRLIRNVPTKVTYIR